MGGSYDAEDGYPICSHILEYDLETNTMTKEEWLRQKWNADISFTDEYNYLKMGSVLGTLFLVFTFFVFFFLFLVDYITYRF